MKETIEDFGKKSPFCQAIPSNIIQYFGLLSALKSKESADLLTGDLTAEYHMIFENRDDLRKFGLKYFVTNPAPQFRAQISSRSIKLFIPLN